MVGAPLLKADLDGVLLKLLLLETLMVVLEECVIQLSFFDVLLHWGPELSQLLLDCGHFGRWHSDVDLRKRNSVLGLAWAFGPWLSLGRALLGRLSLSLYPVVQRDLATENALVLLVQVVDRNDWTILLVSQIIVHSKRSHIFGVFTSVLRVWQRFDMSSLYLLGVVAQLEGRGLKLVSQRTQVGWGLVQAVLVELQKALSLSWLDLLSFDCGINCSVGGRSSGVFQQIVDSVVFKVHDGVGGVLFICHF